MFDKENLYRDLLRSIRESSDRVGKGGAVSGLSTFKRSHAKFHHFMTRRHNGRYTSLDVYTFLVGGPPKCANSSCVSNTKFLGITGGYSLFCRGSSCSKTVQPSGADISDLHWCLGEIRSRYKDVLQLGGGLGLLPRIRTALGQEPLRAIVDSLGDKFTWEDLHQALVPGYDNTCQRAGCSKLTEFNSSPKVLRYRRCCSGGCTWHHTGSEQLRRENYLRSSGGLYTCAMQNPDVSAKVVKATRDTELRLSNGKRSHPSQRADVKRRMVDTARETARHKSGGLYNHHMENPAVVEGRAARELMASGGKYSNSTQRPEVVAKIRNTTNRYFSFKYKASTWRLQGYEDVALRILIEDHGVDARTVETPDNGFHYTDPLGKTRLYFPDLSFVMNGEPYFVEVKSSYTVGKTEHPNLMKANLSKWKGFRDHGYHLIVMVVGTRDDRAGRLRKGNLIEYALVSPDSRSVKFIKGDMKKLMNILRKGD